jgi:hypothetical protein
MAQRQFEFRVALTVKQTPNSYKDNPFRGAIAKQGKLSWMRRTRPGSRGPTSKILRLSSVESTWEVEGEIYGHDFSGLTVVHSECLTIN